MNIEKVGTSGEKIIIDAGTKITIEAVGTSGEEKNHKMILETIAEIQSDLEGIIGDAVEKFEQVKKTNPIIEASDYVIAHIRFNRQIIHILN